MINKKRVRVKNAGYRIQDKMVVTSTWYTLCSTALEVSFLATKVKPQKIRICNLVTHASRDGGFRVVH